MERIVVLCEPSNSTDSQEVFFDDIRENLQKVKEQTNQIWEKLSNQKLGISEIKTSNQTLKGSIPKIDFRIKTINEPNVILAIISNKEKKKIIAAIFDGEKDFELTKKNWVQSNDLEFIIEIVIDNDKDEIWTYSNNLFSAKVYIKLEDLEYLINDLYLEILFKEYFLKNKYFTNVLTPISDYNFSEIKMIFLSDISGLNLSNKIKFYPFSKLARKKNGNYDLDLLYNYWLKFLIKTAINKDVFINPPSSMIPTLKTVNDALYLLPKKHQRNIRKVISEINTGDLLFVYLKRSLIGQDKEKKLHLKALFKNNAKIGTVIILPSSNFNSLSEIKHLLLIVPFKVK
jgi:hypothetical protein